MISLISEWTWKWFCACEKLLSIGGCSDFVSLYLTRSTSICSYIKQTHIKNQALWNMGYHGTTTNIPNQTMDFVHPSNPPTCSTPEIDITPTNYQQNPTKLCKKPQFPQTDPCEPQNKSGEPLPTGANKNKNPPLDKTKATCNVLFTPLRGDPAERLPQPEAHRK